MLTLTHTHVVAKHFSCTELTMLGLAFCHIHRTVRDTCLQTQKSKTKSIETRRKCLGCPVDKPCLNHRLRGRALFGNLDKEEVRSIVQSHFSIPFFWCSLFVPCLKFSLYLLTAYHTFVTLSAAFRQLELVEFRCLPL